MSDVVAGGGSDEVRRSLRRVSARAGSPSASHSSTLRTNGTGSPSDSRSPRTEEFDSGSSSGCLPRRRVEESEDESDTTIPDAIPKHDWSGIRRVRITNCEHGRHTVMKRVWGGRHCGRRFLGCPLEDESAQCCKVVWMDAPWPERVQAIFSKMWQEMKDCKRAEARAAQALQDSLETSDVATLARSAMQEDFSKFKRVASRALERAEAKEAALMVEKDKMMFLVYMLMGVIMILVATVVKMSY